MGTTPTAEFRGVWVTRFEWPNKEGDAASMKSRISQIMETLEGNRFNAVVFQVRGQADVLYPSPFEPWSQLIGGKDPGFDPLAFAIKEAHKRGLEFHAYINAFTCWDKKEPPTDPSHAFNAHPDWLCCKRPGQPFHSEYYYFSPGNPQVQAHVRNVIMDVVQRYDVDGIHLDRIRYPSPETSHDAVSEARFAGIGNPGKLGWEDWQRAQITGFLNDLYGQILAVKPQVKLTSAVWGIYDRTKLPGYNSFSSGYQQYYQDSLAWVHAGVMDALVPMIYWDIGGKKPDYDECYRFFQANAGGRHVYGGIQTKYKDLDEPMREIEYTRSVQGQGIVGFSFTGIDGRNAWGRYRAVYSEKTRVPGMPWKSDPTTGNILGMVRDATGRPVVDAWVRLEGMQAVWLTSADGLFSILNLPPGSDYTLLVESPGVGQVRVEGMKVATATTTPLVIAYPPAGVPVAGGAPEGNTAGPTQSEIAPAPSLPSGSQIRDMPAPAGDETPPTAQAGDDESQPGLSPRSSPAQ